MAVHRSRFKTGPEMAHVWRQIKKALAPDYFSYREVCEECGYLSGEVCTPRDDVEVGGQSHSLVLARWKDAKGKWVVAQMTCDEYKVHSVLSS